MRPVYFFVAFLFAVATATASHGASGFGCVKAQCDGKGRSCVETLYVAFNACTKAARAKCDKVPAAEKFNCLRAGLAPCALTRNKDQAACLADAQSCYKSCAPFAGKRNDYWCVGDTRSGATAAFCAATSGAVSPFNECAKAFDKTAELTGGMMCESLLAD